MRGFSAILAMAAMALGMTPDSGRVLDSPTSQGHHHNGGRKTVGLEKRRRKRYAQRLARRWNRAV